MLGFLAVPSLLATLSQKKCPVLLSYFDFCRCDKTLASSNLGRMGLFHLQSIIKGSRGRSLKQKPQRSTPPGLLPASLQLLPYTTLDQSGTAQGGIDRSPSTSNQENVPTGMPVSQSDGGNSSAAVPSSQACQVDTQEQPSQVPSLSV